MPFIVKNDLVTSKMLQEGVGVGGDRLPFKKSSYHPPPGVSLSKQLLPSQIHPFSLTLQRNRVDKVQFVMCTLLSKEGIPFCKYIKRHVYPKNQGTHDKLNQMQKIYSFYNNNKEMRNWQENFHMITICNNFAINKCKCKIRAFCNSVHSYAM